MAHSATTLHRDETERLKALLHYEVLDTAPDPALTEIAALAARITRAPYAYIGFLDSYRLWFKACVGFLESEQPIETSADQYSVLDAQPYLIEDAANDPRFRSGGIKDRKSVV